MDNIPNGYDENGERAGNGSWNEVCPECGSEDIKTIEGDKAFCNSCECEFEAVEVKKYRARTVDKETGKVGAWKDVVIEC